MSDRLARMEDIEVAALDRRLRLDLASAGSRRGLDRPTVLDHLEGSPGALQLGGQLVADPRSVARRPEGVRFRAVAGDRVERSRDVVTEGIGADLAAPDGVDAGADLAEGRLDPRRQIADLAAEPLHVAGRGDEPAGATKHEPEQG